ncbi:MAG: serine/threonine-protein kinase [Myxococcaceae bacterium]
MGGETLNIRETPSDPLIGKVLNGQYSVLELIGTGGMGRVYKAIQASLDRVVALKVLHPHYNVGGRDPNFHRRFFLEASLTSKLRHPNTITVIDYGKTDDGIYYIAMEFVEGRTLSQLLTATGALRWPRALHIAQQVCRSLREAHRLGVIHRDLKPANVMLLTEDTDHDLVKVLDFGLVKPLDPEDPAESEITQAGMMLGSPMYMAPEQARNHADTRSDLYSLGVVTYQMLMGRPPFESKQSVDVILKHVNDTPPGFKQVRPDLDVPAEVEVVVMRCLEKDPARRYQSMDELLEALRQAALTAGGSAVFTSPRLSFSPRTPPPEPLTTVELEPEEAISDFIVGEELRPRRQSNKLILASVFLACLVVGAAVVWVNRAPQSTAASPGATQPALAAEPSPTTAPAAHVEQQAAPEEPSPPEPIRFRIHSEPKGAIVRIDGRNVGRAPLVWEGVPDADGVAQAVVTLELDGYEPVSAMARGSGPELLLKRTLRKKEAPKKKTPKTDDDDGYKDDPYL